MKKKILFAVGVPLFTATLYFSMLQQGLWQFQDRHTSKLNASLGASATSSTLALHADNDDDNAAAAINRDYDLSAHQILSRVILLIRENYVEPDRIKPYDMFLAALDYIQKTVPEVIIDDSDAPARIYVSVGSAKQVFELDKLEQLWEVTMVLRDIFRFLQTTITDPTQRRDIEYAAINGMLSTLDPHSILLKPESFDEIKLSTKGEFGGLGIVISIRDGALTVISPIEGTPAAKAGLHAKDKIVKIGEESTVNMGLDEAVQKLRGKPGSKVSIWIQRKGSAEPRKFVLARAIIKIESVTSQLLEDGIGYIKIKSFQGNTYDDLQAHLEQLKIKNNKHDLKGLILDLRNNPGGLLDQAILVSDRFIEHGPLVITVSEGNRKREVKSAHAGAFKSIYPIAVLLNGGSASASEIVSGALKNHDRALIIGQQSFGKGSVQVLYDFKDHSALKLTVAQYLTPGDISIQSVGITPDVTIVPASIEKDGVHLFVDDDSPREKDLEKHLDQHGATSVIEPSNIKITHLIPKEKDPTDDAEAMPAEEKALHGFDYDSEIHLAHDVLLSTKSINRKNMLKDAMPLFKTWADDQEKIIAKRLAELGIDWSTGAQTGQPHADVSLTVIGNANHHKPMLVAGDTIVMTAKVHNTGDAPLYRVYGVTNSDNPLLKNLEFMFGKINPGETRSWDYHIKLPHDMSSRADSVSLVLSDMHGAAAHAAGSMFVTIHEQQKPRFAYRFWIDDSNNNGDGVLQIGESVNLNIEVRNLGPGVADDVTLSLKNMAKEAVFLDQGRSKLGSLSVGETKTGTLHFSLRSLTNLHDQTVSVRLAIWDAALGVSLSEVLKLPVAEARTPKAEHVALKVEKGPEIPIFTGANANMPILGYAPRGVFMQSDATYGAWYRIPDLSGFVRTDDVLKVQSIAKNSKLLKHSMHPAAMVSIPDLTIDVPSMVVHSDTYHLVGSVHDEKHLKDIFVFVNDKKIHYQSLEHLQKDALGLHSGIDINIPLKAGANAIAVIVRSDDDLLARKVFFIFREESPAVPTADANSH